VTLETRRRFYDVVTAIHLSNVARGALRVSRDDERRVKALFDVGSVSKSDLLRAQVRSAQSVLDSLTANQNITVTRVLLAQWLGIPEQEMGEIDTLLVAEPRTYVEQQVLSTAERNRPDIQAAEKEVKAAGSAVTSAHFLRVPYVSLSGGMTFDPTFTETSSGTGVDNNGNPVSATAASEVKTDRTWRGAVSLNWNVFDGLFTDSRIAAAKAQQIRSRETLDALKRNLISQVHGVILIYQEAVERDIVARRNVESATENLNLTQQKYNVGSSTVLDLIDAQVQLQRAQSDAVSALAQLRVAEAQIERVQGGP
jgi:outer membrane protein TolC